MEVKGPAEEGPPQPPEEPARPKTDPAGFALNSDLVELLRVMPRVFRGMRRGTEEDPKATPAGIAFAALFKGGGLGPRHIPVLVVLVLEGPLAVGDLAQRLSLSLATVSLMVGELSRTGLVERREDERDRRRTLVSIPDKHRRLLAPFVDHRISPVRRALERMSPEVRAAFLAGWRVLAEEIERAADNDG